jgi:hypothetical protein
VVRIHFRQRWQILVVGVLSVLLAACGSEAVPLTGTVYDAYTKSPVPSAVIEVGSTKAMNDADGRFTIEQWQRTASLTVTAGDYEVFSETLADRTWPDTMTAEAAQLEIQIRPNVIRGVVNDAWSGQPLADVFVSAGGVLSSTTTSDGRYEIVGVPAEFTLQAELSDYTTASVAVAQQTTQDIALENMTLTGVVTDQYSGEALADVKVVAGDQSTTTGADGRYALRNVTDRTAVEFTLEGYAVQTVDAQKLTVQDAVLRPDVLKGTLVSTVDNAAIQHATIVATESLNKSAVARVRIDQTDGQFELKGVPETGFIQVLAPGYRKLVVPIEQGKISSELKLEPFTAKAVYITAAVASNPNLVERFFDNIDKSEQLNSIVIDLKSDLRDDLGLIYYDSQVPIVKELGTAQPRYDIEAILAEAKRRGIYTIARVHMFSHDNILAEAKPEWAAQDRVKGGIFYDYPTSTIKYAWLDPFNENVWDYNIALSVEAALYGFDEINFDYIRFPSLEFGADDGERLQLSREITDPQERYDNIRAVLARAQPAINDAGAFLSVDVFGFTTEGPIDIIGQSIPIMGDVTDYISPMVYPSHYGTGYLGYANPAKYPYEVIYRTMEMGMAQLEGKRARLRPWLQDFTLIWVPDDQIVEYGVAEVQAQIRAVDDVHTDAGWLLYSSDNTYTYEAVP